MQVHYFLIDYVLNLQLMPQAYEAEINSIVCKD